MNSHQRRIVPAVVALSVLCACASPQQSAPTADPAAETSSGNVTPSDPASSPDIVDDMASTSGPGSAGPGLPTGGVSDEVASRPAVQTAVQDLAQRRSVAVEDIVVVGFAQVTWADGALGCPQPGTVYSQALVDGQQLILQVDGADQAPASYHAGRGGTFRYCENPQPPTSGSGAGSR